MSGRYVPPALRAKSQPSAPEDSPATRRSEVSHVDEGLRSSSEISHYYWPNEDARRSQTKSTTLHDSAQTPGTLAYVLLFKGANPRWNEGIIFTKSNLDLLPTDISSESASETPATQSKENDKSKDSKEKPDLNSTRSSNAIAVFKQLSDVRSATVRNFTFDGWYRISRLEFLEPNSEKLVRMLEQKWSYTTSKGQVRQKQRAREGWTQSLSFRWAVVKLEKDEGLTDVLKVPMLEDLDDHLEEKGDTNVDGGKKSVNEMLRQLRMGEEDKKNGTTGETGDGAGGQREERPAS